MEMDSLAKAKRKVESEKVLSVLIPTLASRLPDLSNLLVKLRSQIGDRPDVEVLALLDDKTMWLGDKRNRLLELATGKYLTFLNDDDNIPDYWLEKVLGYIENNPGIDVVSVKGQCLQRENPTAPWHHTWFMATTLESKTWDDIRKFYCDTGSFIDPEDGRHYERIYVHRPVMWCVWRSDIAKRVKFASRTYYEDIKWAELASEIAETEVMTDEVLYYYHADDRTSEAGKWKFFKPGMRSFEKGEVVCAGS
jgi:hypothetical protein